MSSTDGVIVLADLLGEDQSILRDLLLCPPAHSIRHMITSRKGKRRLVAEPDAVLKRVQRGIIRRVLRQIPDHPASFCRSGRSIIDNAQRHLRNRHVYAFDVADAFPSTSHHLVERSLRRSLATHHLPVEIAKPITELCTLDGSLPQGAPTSSGLLDIALRPIDDLLEAASTRRGARYSRYVDDITFSASTAMRWAEREVIQALDRLNFRLRHEKTKKWAPPRPATVTGIVLRDRLELPREYLVRVKTLVMDMAAGRITPRPNELTRIRGAVGHLGRFHPQLGRRLAEEIRRMG